MAGIDKTYVKTWDEYQAMKEWVRKNRYFTTKIGFKLDLYYCVFDWWNEDAFDGEHEIPIMSTTYLEDYFLIKHCDLPFFQEAMIDAYGEDEVNAIKNGTSDFDTFSKEGKYGTRAKIVSAPSVKINRPHKGKWWVEVRQPEGFYSLWYNEELDRWYWADEQGEGNTSVAFVNTINGVLRKVCHWQLPKGSIVLVKGYYTDEEYKILVK